MLYPHPQIYHHLRAIFVHVPKTAGTSIERTLRKKNTDPIGGHTTALAYRRHFPETFPHYFKFTVVRHPVDRFMSAYRYLRREPIHPAHNNAIIHEAQSLGEFVRRLEANPCLIDQIVHFMPQYTFICDENDSVLMDTVYRFERLGEAWSDICSRLALPPQLLPVVNNAPHPESWPEVDGTMEKLIHRMYAKDFELLGYF